MDLFILRHGEAGERSSSLAGDKKRPLTSSGKLEVSEIAKYDASGHNQSIDKWFDGPIMANRWTHLAALYGKTQLHND